MADNDWTDNYRRVSRLSFISQMHGFYHRAAFFDFDPQPQWRILDVGCGDGQFLHDLAARGFSRLYGVDPDPRLVEETRSHDPGGGVIQVRPGSATSLPFDGEYFDCVTFFNVLHHLLFREDYLRAPREVDRVLKPGGMVALVEPCRPWMYQLKRGLCRLLAPGVPLARTILEMMMAERRDVERFFRHHGLIRRGFLSLGYKPLRDRRLAHQWVLVVRKPWE